MRHLLLAAACIPLSGVVPEDAMKLVDRAGGKRVLGQVYLPTGGFRPRYSLNEGVLHIGLDSPELVTTAFTSLGIAFDLPKGITSIRVEADVGAPDERRVWQCGKR